MRALVAGIIVAGLALAACSQSGYRNMDSFLNDPSILTPESMTRAAENGNVEAQRILGSMYHWGEGVEPDDEKARFWWAKAAANGDALAQSYLDAPMNNRAVPGVLHASVGREWWATAEKNYHIVGDYLGLCDKTC
jgi:TPR repeat protein